MQATPPAVGPDSLFYTDCDGYRMAGSDRTLERSNYVDALMKMSGDGKIKIVCGMRGVGKTEIMKQLMARLKEAKKDCVYIDAESADFLEVGYTDALMKKISEAAGNGPMTVIVDEISQIDGWTAALYNLTRSGKLEFYVTSSVDPSDVLKGASIAKEYELLTVRPLSLREFMDLNGIEGESNGAEFYRIYGGMPCIRTSMGPADARRILRSLYFEILYNALDKGADAADVRCFADYIMEHIGESISKEDLKEFLDRRGMGTKKLIEGLERSYLIKAFAPGMFKGSDYRFYAADIGLRNSLPGVRRDWKAETENIVLDELIRRGQEPEAGKGDGESIKSKRTDGVAATYIITDSPVLDTEIQSGLRSGRTVQIVPETEEHRGTKLSAFMLGE